MMSEMPNPKAKKLAVVGSRSITDYSFIKRLLDRKLDSIECIISGGARGVDTLAERWANENRIPIKVFPADWDRWGKRAGYIRNETIIKECDICLAIWDGQSKGTLHSVNLCKKYKKPHLLFDFNS